MLFNKLDTLSYFFELGGIFFIHKYVIITLTRLLHYPCMTFYIVVPEYIKNMMNSFVN